MQHIAVSIRSVVVHEFRQSELVDSGYEVEREQYYMDPRLQPVRLARDNGRIDS
jgi:hypothetical protein